MNGRPRLLEVPEDESLKGEGYSRCPLPHYWTIAAGRFGVKPRPYKMASLSCCAEGLMSVLSTGTAPSSFFV